MRYYFDRLLQFRLDIIIPLPATYHFLFGDILFAIRNSPQSGACSTQIETSERH